MAQCTTPTVRLLVLVSPEPFPPLVARSKAISHTRQAKAIEGSDGRGERQPTLLRPRSQWPPLGSFVNKATSTHRSSRNCRAYCPTPAGGARGCHASQFLLGALSPSPAWRGKVFTACSRPSNGPFLSGAGQKSHTRASPSCPRQRIPVCLAWRTLVSNGSSAPHRVRPTAPFTPSKGLLKQEAP